MHWYRYTEFISINLINIDSLNSYRYRFKVLISIRRFRIDTLNSCACELFSLMSTSLWTVTFSYKRSGARENICNQSDLLLCDSVRVKPNIIDRRIKLIGRFGRVSRFLNSMFHRHRKSQLYALNPWISSTVFHEYQFCGWPVGPWFLYCALEHLWSPGGWECVE